MQIGRGVCLKGAAHKVGDLDDFLVVQLGLLLEVKLATKGCRKAAEHGEEECADNGCLFPERPVLGKGVSAGT